MSLLLDALRRAATTREGPGADRYTLPPGEDASAGAADARADAGRRTSAPEPAAEWTLEPLDAPGPGAPAPAETRDADDTGAATRAGGRIPARAVLAGGRRRRGPQALTVAVVSAAVVVVGIGVAAGGWLYYRTTQRDVARELAGFTPQAEPATVAAAEGGSAGARVPAAAQAGEGATAAATTGGATPADDAGGPAGPDTDGAAAAPAAADPEAAADAAPDRAAPGTAAPAREPDGRSPAAADGGAPGSAPAAAASDAEGSSAARAQGSAAPAAGDPTAGDGATSRRQRPLVRTTTATALADALERGYAALGAGDLGAAADAYARARELAPRNRDALLGAAAVAQRRGAAARARELYERVLADHPRDAYARAALASLAAGSDVGGARAALRRHLRDDPEAPALHFTLGNLYAAEQRWRDAQAAYFNAYRRAPHDPDYAYNLAIALDHLDQRAEARRYYERALALSRDRSASFRRADVRRRLGQLRESS